MVEKTPAAALHAKEPPSEGEPVPAPPEERVQCHLKAIRRAKGISQGRLAELVGVKRQAIYDIESGRYIPNTNVALRLARHLGCRVEDLFAVDEPQLDQPITVVGKDPAACSRLNVARVRDRLIGYPLDGKDMLNDAFQAADGLFLPDKGTVKLFRPATSLTQTALLLGCDPAFAILSAHVRRHAGEARVLCRFSSTFRALEAVASGVAHLAGVHLHNTRQGEANLILAQNTLLNTRATVVAFSFFEEGLMVAPGNPHNIKTVADLARENLRFVNREEGAALRILLDEHLARSGLRTELIGGYNRLVSSHTQGAQVVAFQMADAALGLRAVAVAYGLDFVPIEAVRCDLVLPAEFLDHPAVKVLLEVMQTRAFREELASLPGYESSATGKVIGTV